MEKDIVAVILDLCAKKYLKLFKLENKYFIQVLNNQNGFMSSFRTLFFTQS